MITVTIDTNIVRDFLDPSRDGHTDAVELMRLDAANMCEVRIVSRIKADVPGGPLRSKLEALEIWQRPLIGTVCQLDFSALGDDALATDEQAAEIDLMLDLIFPGADRTSDRHANRVKDVGHLLGHKMAGRDIFISGDKALLKRSRELLGDHSIRVMSCADAVEYIEQHQARAYSAEQATSG